MLKTEVQVCETLNKLPIEAVWSLKEAMYSLRHGQLRKAWTAEKGVDSREELRKAWTVENCPTHLQTCYLITHILVGVFYS